MKSMNIELCMSELLRRFPDFVEVMEPEIDFPYVTFGALARYIIKLVKSPHRDEKKIKEIFDFLNELGDSEYDDVQNLLTVGTLEILTDNDETISCARKYLQRKALENFNEIYKFWCE